jgi:hypothetical protein
MHRFSKAWAACPKLQDELTAMTDAIATPNKPKRRKAVADEHAVQAKAGDEPASKPARKRATRRSAVAPSISAEVRHRLIGVFKIPG